MPPAEKTNPFFDPQVEKNSVQHGNTLILLNMIVTPALLGHQTSHLQNKLFFALVAQYTIKAQRVFLLGIQIGVSQFSKFNTNQRASSQYLQYS